MNGDTVMAADMVMTAARRVAAEWDEGFWGVGPRGTVAITELHNALVDLDIATVRGHDDIGRQQFVDERIATAAELLHERRHPLSRATTCDRCRADARALLPLLTRTEGVPS